MTEYQKRMKMDFFVQLQTFYHFLYICIHVHAKINDYLESIKIHLKIYNAKGLTLQLDKTKNENYDEIAKALVYLTYMYIHT